MTLLYLFLLFLTILLIVNIILTIKAGKKEANNELTEISSSIGTLVSNLKETEKHLKDEFVTNRKESSDTATGLRTEIGTQLNIFTQTFSKQLSSLTNSNELKFDASWKIHTN